MPQAPSPPFVPGAQTEPRQLNRWMDINPQGGPLTRTETFITLPAFSQAVTWRGYSEIIAAFNFEGPNNFSLNSFIAPVNPNYALAIMWVKDGITYRYWLWSGVGEIIYFPEIPYTSQLIGKNFRLEVWSTNVATVSQSAPLTFYTSVLGNYDYRWANDTALVNSDPEVVNFQNINTTPSLPISLTVSVFFNHLVSSSGVTTSVGNVAVWAPIAGHVDLVASGVLEYNPSTELINQVNVIDGSNTTTGYLYTTFSGTTLNSVIVAFRMGSATSATLFEDENGDNTITSTYSGGTSSVVFAQNSGNVGTITNLVQGDWYVAILSIGNCWLYNLATGELVGSATSAQVLSGASTTVKTGTKCSQIVEIMMSNNSMNSPDAQNIANYLANVYSDSFSLPLTFPTNSVPTTN